MSKKKTQLDRAIESIEAEIVELTRRYEGQRLGLEAAVSTMRQQKASVPLRRRKPRGLPAPVGEPS